jgi:hypothetical protein
MYERNYTDRGYLLNYKRPGRHSIFKNQVYQFKIELDEISPTIWRRIIVPSDYNFWDCMLLFKIIWDGMILTCIILKYMEKGKGKLQRLGYLILKERET